MRKFAYDLIYVRFNKFTRIPVVKKKGDTNTNKKVSTVGGALKLTGSSSTIHN